MATKKLSELTTTTSPNSASIFAIAHDGSNFGVTLANVAANLPAVTAASLTSSSTLTTSGNATIGGDLTITGDDLFMGTNTSGAALIADGTNFNPVVISGDIVIATNGAATIQADAVEGSMLNDNVISGQTEITSGLADADELLYSDAGTLKRVGMDTMKTYFSPVAGSSSIVTTGTIGTGTWEATDIAVSHGGTGASTLTANGVLIGNGTSAITAVDLSTKGKLLVGDGSGNPSALTVGTNNHVLTADSSEGTGIKWAAVSASTPTDITVADESSDTTCFPLFVTAATGDLGPKTGSNLAFNSSSGLLTATGFSGPLTGNVTGNASGSSGSCTGNSATATLSTNVTVADESSDTTCFPLFVTAATGDLPPKSGSNLAFNSSSGVLTATGFAGDITGNVTGNTSGSAGSCTGNSATATTSTNVTVADESSDTTCFPLFTTAATGDLAPKSGSNLAFNSSSGVLTATGFAGDITGNVTGNASGTAAGLSSTLVVGSGGTGATSLTANGVLIGNGTSAVTAVDLSTKGKILIGDGSGNPSALAVGSNGYVLTAASGEATGVSWAEAGGGGPNAWVNFNGTGTVAIRANSNVSSITDRATGKYTVNFTSDMDDDDYCVAATTNLDAVRDLGFRTQAFAVGSIEVEQFNSDSNYKDAEFGCVAVFR
tara:strand:- start:1233 stop:3218 length:1986 start_codon:yes stop_codon:yes gene_type:complete